MDILRASAQLVFFCAVAEERFVFSVRVEDVQLGQAGPPGGAAGWRAVTRVLRSSAKALSAVRDDLITTGFPGDCELCGGPMTAWSGTPVCAACEAAVVKQAASLCSVCGEALGMESARFAVAMGASACTMCRMAPPAFARAVAFGAYEDELREMLHLLKYQRMTRLAEGKLSEWLAAAMLMLREDAADDILVVAVPLFAARERQRGFNQSALLADAAVRRMKMLRPAWCLRASHGALARIKDTREQYVLNPRQRRANLRGAFRVADEAAVSGREVMLVDDIFTTGATSRECARVLLRAGAAKVWVATLARAQAEVAVATWDSSGVAGFSNAGPSAASSLRADYGRDDGMWGGADKVF